MSRFIPCTKCNEPFVQTEYQRQHHNNICIVCRKNDQADRRKKTSDQKEQEQKERVIRREKAFFDSVNMDWKSHVEGWDEIKERSE